MVDKCSNLQVPIVLILGGPRLPGTLRAWRCLHRDCFTVYIQTTIGFHVYLGTLYRHSIVTTHTGHPLRSLQTPSVFVAIGL